MSLRQSRLRRSSITLGIALALAGAEACGIPTGLGKNGMDKLVQQRRKWEAIAPITYEYVVRNRCDCSMSGVELRVVIHGGLLDSVSFVTTGERVADGGNLTLTGITGLFTKLAEAYSRRPHDVDVVYDETWGFPRHVYIDYSKYYRHDDHWWTVVSFTPLR